VTAVGSLQESDPLRVAVHCYSPVCCLLPTGRKQFVLVAPASRPFFASDCLVAAPSTCCFRERGYRFLGSWHYRISNLKGKHRLQDSCRNTRCKVIFCSGRSAVLGTVSGALLHRHQNACSNALFLYTAQCLVNTSP
jgi:hypothetical protein